MIQRMLDLVILYDLNVVVNFQWVESTLGPATESLSQKLLCRLSIVNT